MPYNPPDASAGSPANDPQPAPVLTANELRETCEARRPARMVNGAEVHAFAVSDQGAPQPEQVLGLTPVHQAQQLYEAPGARMLVTRDMLDVLVFLASDDDGYEAVLQELRAA